MRLLHTATLLFEEFIGNQIPEYAILSHTWGDEEVSFQDMKDPSSQNKQGYQKIKTTCYMAYNAGLKYAWIDTCCIDKSSSAELTEAINSMYRWYQRAKICYAYLEDLPSGTELVITLPKCRWFTRGWTLQELIAPREIYFLDENWNSRGQKRELIELLSSITHIDKEVLLYQRPLSSVIVAQKMSWAANRETTRLEDIAYCLLGIFNVNMPLLYGEEEKAFRRLQEEIIKSTADWSIFAWTRPVDPAKTRDNEARIFCGILAQSPQDFYKCTSFVKVPRDAGREFSVSNVGIKTRIELLTEYIPDGEGYNYILPLDCSSQRYGVHLGIRLRKCGPDQFIREDPWTLIEDVEDDWLEAPEEIHLLTDTGEGDYDSQFILESRSHVFQIQLVSEMQFYNQWPVARFDEEGQLFFIPENSKWDVCAGILGGDLTTKVGEKTLSIKFECMLHAVGWSSIKPAAVQCSLTDYGKFPTETQSDIENWNSNASQVLSLFEDRRIPKVSKVAFKVEGTEFSILLSFKLTLIEDAKICLNKFWRIGFSWEAFKDADLPPIPIEKWVS